MPERSGVGREDLQCKGEGAWAARLVSLQVGGRASSGSQKRPHREIGEQQGQRGGKENWTSAEGWDTPPGVPGLSLGHRKCL